MLKPAETYTHTHTTKALLVFFLVFAIIPSFAQHPRITQLIAEKQAKMEKLEKCQGTTKKLKIAGISTLGVTAVGVGANIAEAVILKDKESKIATAKEELTKQQEQKEKRECEKEGSNKKYKDGKCECIDGYSKDDDTGNCVEKQKQQEPGNTSDSTDDALKQFEKACQDAGYNPDRDTDNNNYVICTIGGNVNINAKPAYMIKALDAASLDDRIKNARCISAIMLDKTYWSVLCYDNDNNIIGDIRYKYKNLICEDDEVEKDGECVKQQAETFSTACTEAGYKPDDQKNGSGDVTEHSCFAYLSEAATQDIADAKFKLIKESCPGSTIQWADDTYAYFVANCGADANGIPNRFYVKQRGGTNNNAVKRLEKACGDAEYDLVRASNDQNYVVCTIGGDTGKDAEPSVMNDALSRAAEKLKNVGCGGKISRCDPDSCWFVACKDGEKMIGDIRYEYKNLICKDDEVEKGGECKPLNCDANKYEVAKNHKCEECADDKKLEDGKCVPVVCNGTLADTYLEKRQHRCYLKADVFSIDFSLKRAKSKDDAKQQIDNWMKTNIGFSIDSFKCTVIEAYPVFGNDVVECKNTNTIFQFSFQNISDVDEGNTL